MAVIGDLLSEAPMNDLSVSKDYRSSGGVIDRDRWRAAQSKVIRTSAMNVAKAKRRHAKAVAERSAEVTLT